LRNEEISDQPADVVQRVPVVLPVVKLNVEVEAVQLVLLGQGQRMLAVTLRTLKTIYM
jgi:hypothetical protein